MPKPSHQRWYSKGLSHQRGDHSQPGEAPCGLNWALPVPCVLRTTLGAGGEGLGETRSVLGVGLGCLMFVLHHFPLSLCFPTFTILLFMFLLFAPCGLCVKFYFLFHWWGLRTPESRESCSALLTWSSSFILLKKDGGEQKGQYADKRSPERQKQAARPPLAESSLQPGRLGVMLALPLTHCATVPSTPGFLYVKGPVRAFTS